MADSQNFNPTSNPTLAKLQEVDSELAVQEEELLSRLKSVQEKRRSLKTVISLFTGADIPATALVEAAQTPPAETNGKLEEEPAQTPPAETNGKLEAVDEDLVAPLLENLRAPDTAEPETEAVADTQSNSAKKKASSPSRGNKTTKSSPVKAVKKTSRWQDYVREEFSNTSLPQAVTSVLQRRTDKVLEASAILNAIFVDEIPKEVVDKARRQVTNILSNGARKNKWYRGQLGYYSMSRAAIKASSS